MQTIPRAPGALPIAGHAAQLLKDPTGFLTSLRGIGDLVEIRLGTKRVYVPATPELATLVFLNSHHTYDKGGPFFENIATFFGSGLATCPNAIHPRLRRLLQPAFRPDQIRQYSSRVTQATHSVCDTWHPGEHVDARKAMQDIATRTTIATLMPTWPRDDSEVLHDVNTLIGGVFQRMIMPAITRLPLPANQRFRNATSRLDEMIEQTLATHRRQPAPDGILPILTTPDDGDMLTDQEIRDQVMTMFVAGIGTTASTLAWALHHLSLDTALASRVHQQITDHLGGRDPAYDDLHAFPALGNTITETLRMWPTAWLMSRVTTTETALGTYRLPAHSDVLISPYIFHHDPALFPSPEQFDPDRWSTLNTTTKGYLPFGAGPRKCIGNNLALTNITLTLATILQHHRLTPTKPVAPAARAILEPRGLQLIAQRSGVCREEGVAADGEGDSNDYFRS